MSARLRRNRIKAALITMRVNHVENLALQSLANVAAQRPIRLGARLPHPAACRATPGPRDKAGACKRRRVAPKLHRRHSTPFEAAARVLELSGDLSCTPTYPPVYARAVLLCMSFA